MTERQAILNQIKMYQADIREYEVDIMVANAKVEELGRIIADLQLAMEQTSRKKKSIDFVEGYLKKGK